MSFEYVVYQTNYTRRLDPTIYNNDQEDGPRPDIEGMIESFREKDLEVLAVHDFCVSEREHFFTHDKADIAICQEIIQWVAIKSGHRNCRGCIILKSTDGGIEGLDALQHVSILDNLGYCHMYPQNWDYEKLKVNGSEELYNAIYFNIDAESG